YTTLSFGSAFSSLATKSGSFAFLARSPSGTRTAPATCPLSHSAGSRTSTSTAFLSATCCFTLSSESLVCSGSASANDANRQTVVDISAMRVSIWSLSKLCASRRSRKRNYVADVGHAGDKLHDPLEPQSEARVRHRAVAAQVGIPPIAGRVE